MTIEYQGYMITEYPDGKVDVETSCGSLIDGDFDNIEEAMQCIDKYLKEGQ